MTNQCGTTGCDETAEFLATMPRSERAPLQVKLCLDDAERVETLEMPGVKVTDLEGNEI